MCHGQVSETWKFPPLEMSIDAPLALSAAPVPAKECRIYVAIRMCLVRSNVVWLRCTRIMMVEKLHYSVESTNVFGSMLFYMQQDSTMYYQVSEQCA